MNIKNLREGMKVKISRDISKTERFFDACPTMWDTYAGTVREVKKVGNNRVYIGNYAWHPDDLQSIIKPKEKKSLTFDIDELA